MSTVVCAWVAVVTAAGAALGGYYGGVVTNGYIGEIRSFNIAKIHHGRGPAVIVANGLLTEKDIDTRDWEVALDRHFPKNPWYYLRWESKVLQELGTLLGAAAGKVALEGFFVKVAKRASKEAASAIGWMTAIADLIGNPRHTAMVKAEMTGIVLADLIARTKHKSGFVLIEEQVVRAAGVER